jgi:hypothetical protein
MTNTIVAPASVEHLIPTCCSCNKIRLPNGKWVDKLVVADGEVMTMSHTLCDPCAAKNYPEMYSEMVRRGMRPAEHAIAQ